MTIPWFTIIAQIINFLVLVALLKHFLYGRIIEAMDRREEKISSELRQAQEKREEAVKKSQDLDRQRQELEKKKDDLISEAKEEADQKRKELIHQARDEVNQQQKQWKKDLEHQRESFLDDLRKTISNQLIRTTGKVLEDLSDRSLEEQCIEIFFQKIEKLEQSQKEKIKNRLESSKSAVEIRSGFELKDNVRDKLKESLSEIFSYSGDIDFKTSENILAGIEMEAGGEKIFWSIDAYVDQLEKRVDHVLQEQIEKSSEGKKEEKQQEQEKDKKEKAEKPPGESDEKS